MVADRKKFTRALNHWDELHANEEYSYPPEYGTAAVMYSRYTLGTTRRERRQELEMFCSEAEHIANALYQREHDVQVIRNISAQSLESVFKDREISDVVLIGHGALSHIWLDSGEDYDWADVSAATDHLKTGVIVQRFCGHIVRQTSVPFATFAASDHSRVIAPVGSYFAPEDDPEDDDLLKPITQRSRLTYDTIKRLFPLLDSDDSSSETSTTE